MLEIKGEFYQKEKEKKKDHKMLSIVFSMGPKIPIGPRKMAIGKEKSTDLTMKSITGLLGPL